MPISPIQAFWIAAAARPEFESAWNDLRRETALLEFATPGAAVASLSSRAAAPALVVLAQSRPGEFPRSELDALANLAPLARFILLLGNWCEGETRTGQVWPVAKRVFWHEWPEQWRRNGSALLAGRNATWLAPVTSLYEERFLPSGHRAGKSTEHTTCFDAAGSRPLVVVSGFRSSFSEALCAACSLRGYATLWQRPGAATNARGPVAIVWDGVQLAAEEAAELAQLTEVYPRTPILALLDFPRWETVQRAIAAGASAALAKPLLLDDLWSQLDAWTRLAQPTFREQEARSVQPGISDPAA